ncbi:MAG TPA: tail fiber domain-containing protein, partial [Myxococcales bacterium]|nr:tail fiber domain-containing protein [Myxococcales bacterium]
MLAPNGSGDIYLISNPVYIGEDTADTVLSTSPNASLILNTYGGTNSNYIKINKGIGGDVDVSLTTGSQFHVSGNQNPVKLGGVEAGTAASNNHYLALDSTNSLVLTNPHADGGATALNELSDVAYSSGDLTISGLDTIVASADLTFDAGGDIRLDAAGSNIGFAEGGTVFATFTEDGDDAYLNFGTGVGTSGYGIRDSNGSIEAKDSGGAWRAIPSLDVNIANLTARLPQITENVTIGDATDVTVTLAGDLIVSGDIKAPAGAATGFLDISGSAEGLAISGSSVVFVGQGGTGYPPTIGVGVADPTYAVHLKNVADASGQILANAFPTYSSRRYKNNVMPITGALDKAAQLRGVTFEWDGTNKKDIG